MDTYHGHVRTPADAIKLFEACRLGLLPRVQRRLSEKERQSIKSGSVFVWDEREAGMRRWTDGKSWSASRVSGSFLTYREMEGKRGGGQFVPPPARQRVAGKTPDSGRGSDEDLDMDGDGPDGYRYKPDGLMKQSFSITTTTGQHLHLISYYSRPHANSPDLPQPTTDPNLRNIVPQKGMYPESTIHDVQGPVVTTRPMQQQSPFMQQSPHQHPQYQHSQRGPPPPQYPYQVAQGYAWPPSPMSTPPFSHYPGSIYNSPIPPRPGSAHSSPYQHHSPHQMNHIPTTSMPLQGPTIFDRPPRMSDSSLPPPPPPPHYRPMSTATQANMMSNHVPNPSPRVAQAALIAQQAQIAERALNSQPQIDPRLSQSFRPVQDPRTVSPTHQLPPLQRTATPPQPQQLPSAQPQHPSPPPQLSIQIQRSTTPPQSLSHSQANTPSSTGRPVTPKGQNIPSISSMVHAENLVSVMDDNKPSNSRAGSRSPKGSREEQPARDIPHEKLNIVGEDQRAIRVLDRKFCI